MSHRMLLYLLCIFTFSTQAATLGTLNNKAGGKIVFTDETCEIRNKTYKNLRRAYLYTETGETNEGCYTIDGETLWTVWETGDQRRYPIRDLDLPKQRNRTQL